MTKAASPLTAPFTPEHLKGQTTKKINYSPSCGSKLYAVKIQKGQKYMKSSVANAIKNEIMIMSKCSPHIVFDH